MPIVVKYGGNAMTEPAARREVALELRRLADAGQAPVVVHGGGPFIAAALDAAGLAHRFERGLRVTSPESLAVIAQVLLGLNKALAQEIGAAVGLSGHDARALEARRFDPALGQVGRMCGVNRALLTHLLAGGYTPVLACLAADADEEGAVLNVNADEVAAQVAGALACPALFLTNVPGVLDDPGDPASLLPTLSRAEAEARIADGRIAGGMIPKVESALAALAAGARHAVIADGRGATGLRAALAGAGGTRVVRA